MVRDAPGARGSAAVTPDREAVVATYLDGVAAVEGLSSSIAERGAWAEPACGEWDAAVVVRHLVAVIGWYHGWLDRAEAGDASPPFALAELPERNEAALADTDLGPVEAAARFVAEAERYRDRTAGAWDLPYGYPGGTVRAGLHAGVAAAEWHLHAWDLAAAVGADHEPADPAS